MEDLKKVISMRCIELGITQTALCKKIGMPESTYYEKLRLNRLTISELCAICKVLRMRPEVHANERG